MAIEYDVILIYPSFLGVNLKKRELLSSGGGVLSLLFTDFIERVDLIVFYLFFYDQFQSLVDGEWRYLYELFKIECSFLSQGSNIVLYLLEERSESVYCLLLKLDKG